MVTVAVAFVSGFKREIVKGFHMAVEQRGVDIHIAAVARIVVAFAVAAPVRNSGRTVVIEAFYVREIEYTGGPLDVGSVKKSVVITLPRSKFAAFAEAEIGTVVGEDT